MPMDHGVTGTSRAEERGELLVEVRPPIGWITLNRPQQRNAMTQDLWEGVAEAVGRLDRDGRVRILVIRGAGDKAFAAGADITELDEVRRDSARIAAYLRAVEGLMVAIEEAEKPVIAMVNGAAIGGGCEVATACDLRVASERAQFGIPAGTLSIVIAFPDVRRLAGLVGVGRAKELLMTGRLVTAQEALQIGLVTMVVPPDRLEAETVRLAERLAAQAPLTLQGAKAMATRILRGEAAASPEEALRPSIEAWHSADFGEGVRAYIEKRAPVFREE
ncbi:MAG TPA: enoyl-CoA hydratase-related protein [Candidatus Methylomirabilis sp.]